MTPRRVLVWCALLGVIVVVAAASAVALVCWYFGADVWHAIVGGACLAVVRITWIAWPDHRSVPWRENDGPREGGRWDVARLSWSLYGPRGRVGREALRRVQSIDAGFRLSAGAGFHRTFPC